MLAKQSRIPALQYKCNRKGVNQFWASMSILWLKPEPTYATVERATRVAGESARRPASDVISRADGLFSLAAEGTQQLCVYRGDALKLAFQPHYLLFLLHVGRTTCYARTLLKCTTAPHLHSRFLPPLFLLSASSLGQLCHCTSST